MESRFHFGIRMEREAAALLEASGWRLLASNFRARFGEIDLIAEENLGSARRELVFVEVRVRRAGSWAQGIESVDALKAWRIRRVAGMYLAKYRGGASSVRFDLMAWDGRSWRHFRDAWSA